jgi:uncharacterized protein (DUF4415 family)
MTPKPKKTSQKKTRPRAGKVRKLHASFEDDLQSLMETGEEAESRWSRPRRERICLRIDIEVVDWFKSKGPGYQTRINRVLRRVMEEGKKREK